MEAILASNNKHKLIEIRKYLSGKFQNIYSLKDKNINIEIVEDGDSFLANALIKAKTIAKLTNLPTIADDSGICVDALDGAPGIYSARFAGEPCNDELNNQKLLKELENKNAMDASQRKAHYVAVIVIYFPDTDTYKYAEGKTYGTILKEYRGSNGFGYDPLFLSDDLNKTLAEVDLEEKNKVSHRARALESLLKQL